MQASRVENAQLPRKNWHITTLFSTLAKREATSPLFATLANQQRASLLFATLAKSE
jgi:hypothetical protein